MANRNSASARYQKKLDQVVVQFQHQTDVPAWVLADSGAVRAVAADEHISFGPRGRVVHNILNVTGRTIASLLVVWVIGFLVVVKWWFLAALAKKTPLEGVLIGIGAGSEDDLFSRFEAELDGRAMRVDNCDPCSFGCVAKPELGRLLTHLWEECRRVFEGLRHSGRVEFARNFEGWMTLSAMRVATYVFVKTWAEQLPPGFRRLVFVAADVQCFAAVDGRGTPESWAIEYWQHGLHGRGILIPRVDRIVALDYPEGLQMRRLSGIPFDVVGEYGFPFWNERAETLLFASIYTSSGFDKKNHIDLLKEFFSWAERNGLSVVVRPHPREDPSFWSEHFPLIRIDLEEISFFNCVRYWKPKFIASWFSTALLDSLRYGVAPILLTEGSAPFLAEMVLPLEDIALRWPIDRTLIETLTRDSLESRRWVTEKQEEVFSSSLRAGTQELE